MQTQFGPDPIIFVHPTTKLYLYCQAIDWLPFLCWNDDLNRFAGNNVQFLALVAFNLL